MSLDNSIDASDSDTSGDEMVTDSLSGRSGRSGRRGRRRSSQGYKRYPSRPNPRPIPDFSKKPWWERQCRGEFSDPRRRFISKSPTQCRTLNFRCPEGERPFNNVCGCGCLKERRRPSPVLQVCPSDSSRPQACTRQYDPVCGCRVVNVYGDRVRVRCDGYSNGCSACSDPRVLFWYRGGCEPGGSPLGSAGRSESDGTIMYSMSDMPVGSTQRLGAAVAAASSTVGPGRLRPGTPREPPTVPPSVDPYEPPMVPRLPPRSAKGSQLTAFGAPGSTSPLISGTLVRPNVVLGTRAAGGFSGSFYE